VSLDDTYRPTWSQKISADELRARLKWWIDMSETMPEGADAVSRRVFVLGMIGSQK
jgi:LETM1 and EF-hand domain-containing protein 1